MAPPGERAGEEEEGDEVAGPGSGQGESEMEVSQENASWLGSRGGLTQVRIMRASGCALELAKGQNGEDVVRFSGDEKAIRIAKLCTRLILETRSPPAMPSLDEAECDTDCTLLRVPGEAVGPVTGKGGQCLRSLEDEHGVVMVFVKMDVPLAEGDDGEDLVIFGAGTHGVRGRRAAQLAVMSIVEGKVPGYFVQAFQESGELYEHPADLEGDWATVTRELADNELAYLIGRSGGTRRKMQAASGCLVTYLGNVAFISGTKKQRDRAQEYIQWLLHQIEDPENREFKVQAQGRKDCTVISIPGDCAGIVNGKKREYLSSVEEHWGVLAFFVERDREDWLNLAIFGPLRSRCGAELQIKSTVETKEPGTFTNGLKSTESRAEGFTRDHLVLADSDISYALGKGGTTRRKLATASNAILQFIGSFAIVAGTLVERRRCRDYLQWLLEQKDGKVRVDGRGRTDMTELHFEDTEYHWLLRGAGNSEARAIEQETGTFLFTAENSKGEESLFICGHDAGAPHSKTGRMRAQKMVEDAIAGHSWRGGGGGSGSGRGGWAESSSGRWGGGGGSSWSGNSWRNAGSGGGSSWKGDGGGDSWSKGGGSGERWGRERSRTPQRSWAPASDSWSRDKGVAALPAQRPQSYQSSGGARAWDSRQPREQTKSWDDGETWEPAQGEPIPPWRQKASQARSGYAGGGRR